MATAEEVFGIEAQVHEIMVRFRANRLSSDEVRRGLQAIMEGKFRVAVQTYPVTVDVICPFEDRKAAAGPWTRWDPDISPENFVVDHPVDGVVELELHHFNRAISDAQATQELDTLGLERVSQLSIIVAFLGAYPDLQREFPIVTGATLKYSSDSARGVVFAGGNPQKRCLDFVQVDSGWRASCRFLVRRK